MAEISEHSAEIGGRLIAWREAPSEGTTPLYVHGVPESSEMWAPFLEQTGGVAIDLPGFGRSAKASDGPYTIDGLADAIEALLAHLGVDRVRLVAHDWGAVALAFAQRAPERIERLVLADVVPFLPGYRWHRVARAWRTPVVGELTMGFTTRMGMARSTRLPRDAVAAIMRHFDHGTQRAILKLYRSAPPDVLEAAGRDLGRIDAPALIVWGERDPYLPTSFAHGLAGALGTPDPQVEIVPGAGHWVWVDDPAQVSRIVRFVGASDV